MLSRVAQSAAKAVVSTMSMVLLSCSSRLKQSKR